MASKKDKGRKKDIRIENKAVSGGESNGAFVLKDAIQKVCGPLGPTQRMNNTDKNLNLERTLDKYGDTWKQKLGKVLEFLRKYEWEAVITAATSLIEDINSKCPIVKTVHTPTTSGSNEPEIQVGFVTTFVFERYRATEYRAIARKCLGDLERAIDDATDALRQMQAPVDCGDLKMTGKITMLRTRGLCLEELGRLPEAVLDYRGVLAIRRIIREKPEWGKAEFLQELNDFFRATILVKQASGVIRPYFSKKERRAIEKELRINEFDHESYKICAGCKKPALKLCIRCQLSWYCSKDCQTAAWHAGHKKTCGKIKMKFLSSGAVDCGIHKNGGVCYALREEGQVRVYMKGEEANTLFDSLSNNDAIVERIGLGGEVSQSTVDTIEQMMQLFFSMVKHC